MDDERLKNLGGGNYFEELLSRIRDIRSSEGELERMSCQVMESAKRRLEILLICMNCLLQVLKHCETNESEGESVILSESSFSFQ